MFPALAGWLYMVLTYWLLWPKDTPVEEGSTETCREQAGNLSLLLFSLLLSSLSLACGLTTVQCHHLHCGTSAVGICQWWNLPSSRISVGESTIQGTTLNLAIHLSGDVGVLWEERRLYWDLSITGAKGESGWSSCLLTPPEGPLHLRLMSLGLENTFRWLQLTRWWPTTRDGPAQATGQGRTGGGKSILSS